MEAAPKGLNLRSTHFWIRLLTWVFALSMAFDFRAGEEGGSAIQYLFLAAAMGSGLCVAILGYRAILMKPGFYLVALWTAYIVFVTISSFLNGVAPGNMFRVILPYLLVLMGMVVSQVVAGSGMPAKTVLVPLLICAVINTVWRVIYGFTALGLTLSTVRYEILSPVLPFSFAFIGLTFALAPRFSAAPIIVAATALGCVFLSVTRGLLFPMAASFMMVTICTFCSVGWNVIQPKELAKKLPGAGAIVGVILLLMVVVGVANPTVVERWTERLFDNSGGGATTKDVSILTREAEAIAMLDIMEKEPGTFIYGQGMGANYYWDPSFYPELHLVWPADHDFSGDVWFAGHSIWTYAIFTGGFIGLFFHFGFFGGIVWSSFSGAKRLGLATKRRGYFDPEAFLAFLPAITVLCVLSQSATSNYFGERLGGLVFGLMAGYPQFFHYRARILSEPHHPL